jgi:hypothetical protein
MTVGKPRKRGPADEENYLMEVRVKRLKGNS